MTIDPVDERVAQLCGECRQPRQRQARWLEEHWFRQGSFNSKVSTVNN